MTDRLPDFALDQYAATSCPVKTQNAFDLRLGAVGLASPDAVPVDPRGARALAQVEQIAHVLRNRHGSHVRDLRGLGSSATRMAATTAAMAEGMPMIVGGELPVDWEQHRRGTVDLLLRDEDGTDGRPVYHPVVVTHHPVLAAVAKGHDTQLIASLTSPFRLKARPKARRFRIETCAPDLLRLAHLRLLVDWAGYGADRDWAAVIGPAAVDRSRGYAVVWIDLRERQVPAFAYASGSQWRKYSPLSRYQHEHRFRVRVANHALQQTGGDSEPDLVASPVHILECDSCQWWPRCRTQLVDDVSTAIERSPLDAREIMTLRSLGVTTTQELAEADLDALLPHYLPQVAHRSGAEDRLRLAAHRGRLITNGTVLERLTIGRIDLPASAIEIDFDIENSAQGQVYLWGFLVNDRRQPDQAPVYQSIHSFAEMSAADEIALADEAATWLRDLVAANPGVAINVWHYSNYELSTLHRLNQLAGQTASGALAWLVNFSHDHFVDLLDLVKQNFFGVHGLGLKAVATEGAGFAWRDPNPGGLNSQLWYADAVNGATAEIRLAAETRVLNYNEDDVRANLAVRQWMRSLT